jgi:hypothetical protein
MYALIQCASCKGAVQVAEESLGREVLCPLCGKATLAHRVPVAAPIARPVGEPVPLSLDDAEDLPSAPPRPTSRRPGRRAWILSLALTALAVALVWAAFRYQSGVVPASAWRDFEPPDAGFRVRLPAEPVEVPFEATDPRVRAAKRFRAVRWFEGVVAEVAWLQVGEAILIPGAFEQLAIVLRDHTAARHGGTVEREGVVRFDKHEGREYQIRTPNGLIVERFLLVPGRSGPRIVVLSVAGKRLTGDSPAVRTFFDSLRIAPE